MKEKPTAIRSFMEKNNYSSKVLLDSDGVVAKKYDVLGIPVSFVIDKDGKMVYRLVGYVDWNTKEIRSLVDRLMDDRKS